MSGRRHWNEQDGNYLLHLRTYEEDSRLTASEVVVELRDGRSYHLRDNCLGKFLNFALKTDSLEYLAGKLQELSYDPVPHQTPLAVWHCLRDQAAAAGRP